MPDKEPFCIDIVFAGEPITKSNNLRMANGHVMIPTKFTRYEQDLALIAKVAMNKKRLVPTKCLVRVIIHYYHKSVKEKDLPNLPKTTADALNKIVYEDDSQIHEAHLYRHLDRLRPRVEIHVEEMEDSSWLSIKQSKKA